MEELSKTLQQMMEDPGSRQNLLALVNAFSAGSVPAAAAPTGSTGTAAFSIFAVSPSVIMRGIFS